jgi:hypothetical protein
VPARSSTSKPRSGGVFLAVKRFDEKSLKAFLVLEQPVSPHVDFGDTESGS